MKKIFYTSLFFVLFVLASCKCTVTAPPLTSRTPDILNKPSHTVVAHETIVELPRESEVKTEESVEAILTKDTEVKYKLEDGLMIEPTSVILPEKTEVLIPKDVYLQVTKAAEIKLEPLTDVILPQGTEITISKVNWYAILFYFLLFLVASAWFIKSRQNDKNEDGFEDITKETKKKK